MKKLILSALACIALVISSCNQNSPAPAPATPAPTPTPTPTSSMTAIEALLVGNWIWDKEEEYISGNLFSTITTSNIISANGSVTTNTAYAGSHMVLKSTTVGYPNTVGIMSQRYNADYYSYLSQSSGWYVQPTALGDQLNLTIYNPFVTGGGAGAYIITLNATTLIYQSWIPGQIPNGIKSYYHK